MCAGDRFREYVRAGVPAIAIVLGCGPACADTIEGLISRYGGPTIIVGTDVPDILAPHVQRVRHDQRLRRRSPRAPGTPGGPSTGRSVLAP